jgi:hypothetical protein
MGLILHVKFKFHLDLYVTVLCQTRRQNAVSSSVRSFLEELSGIAVDGFEVSAFYNKLTIKGNLIMARM